MEIEPFWAEGVMKIEVGMEYTFEGNRYRVIATDDPTLYPPSPIRVRLVELNRPYRVSGAKDAEEGLEFVLTTAQAEEALAGFPETEPEPETRSVSDIVTEIRTVYKSRPKDAYHLAQLAIELASAVERKD